LCFEIHRGKSITVSTEDKSPKKLNPTNILLWGQLIDTYFMISLQNVHRNGSHGPESAYRIRLTTRCSFEKRGCTIFALLQWRARTHHGSLVNFVILYTVYSAGIWLGNCCEFFCACHYGYITKFFGQGPKIVFSRHDFHEVFGTLWMGSNVQIDCLRNCA
jgi:hypothetical protein